MLIDRLGVVSMWPWVHVCVYICVHVRVYAFVYFSMSLCVLKFICSRK